MVQTDAGQGFTALNSVVAWFARIFCTRQGLDSVLLGSGHGRWRFTQGRTVFHGRGTLGCRAGRWDSPSPPIV